MKKKSVNNGKKQNSTSKNQAAFRNKNIDVDTLLSQIENLLKTEIISESEFDNLKQKILSKNNNQSDAATETKIDNFPTEYIHSNSHQLNQKNNFELSKNNQIKKVVLEVINLTKHYPKRTKPAISNLNFQLKEGQFHVFVGANGAGKTTTIKAIVGAYAKWKGKIIINGKPNNKTLSKVNLGYIPETALFPKNMTTRQYLVSMAMMSGIKKKNAQKFANDKLTELNMQNIANKNPNTFSSGQQKKILLAQALVHNPQILIMDEPVANLDPTSRNEFYNLLKNLQNNGKTIFLSSHVLAEIGKYANYVTILDGGKIVYSGEIKPDEDLEKLYFSYVKLGSVDTGLNQININQK